MELSQASFDRYRDALFDYEKIANEQFNPDREAYRKEAEKIRVFLKGAIVRTEVMGIIGSLHLVDYIH